MSREPGVEIERKYLLRGMPSLPIGARPLLIEQGWIPGTRILERLRRTQGDDGTRYFRTIKFGKGIQRQEVEEEIAAELFERMWPLTEGRRIRKRRHRVPASALTWEIDEFLDRDLVLAEIELPAIDAAVVLPPWLAPSIVREVTDDPTYVNSNLARASSDRR